MATGQAKKLSWLWEWVVVQFSVTAGVTCAGGRMKHLRRHHWLKVDFWTLRSWIKTSPLIRNLWQAQVCNNCWEELKTRGNLFMKANSCSGKVALQPDSNTCVFVAHNVILGECWATTSWLYTNWSHFVRLGCIRNLEYLHFPRKDSLLLYLKALSKAVTSHSSSLIEESIEFTNFFTNNILTIREKITDHRYIICSATFNTIYIYLVFIWLILLH